MLPLDRMKGLDKHDRLSIRGFGRDADASIPGSGDSTDAEAAWRFMLGVGVGEVGSPGPISAWLGPTLAFLPAVVAR